MDILTLAKQNQEISQITLNVVSELAAFLGYQPDQPRAEQKSGRNEIEHLLIDSATNTETAHKLFCEIAGRVGLNGQMEMPVNPQPLIKNPASVCGFN